MNTLKGMALHPRTRAPWLGGGSGGVSGPAIRAIALEQVAAVSRRVSNPGDRHGRHPDAAATPPISSRAGAACVAVGTESFRDPAAGARVADELARHFAR